MPLSPPLLRRALRAANYRRPSMAVIAARSIAITLGACLLLLGVMSVLADAVRAQSGTPLSPSNPSVRSALSHLADTRGLWGSVGLGRASGSLQCQACAKSATYASARHASIGWRLGAALLVGGETLA